MILLASVVDPAPFYISGGAMLMAAFVVVEQEIANWWARRKDKRNEQGKR